MTGMYSKVLNPYKKRILSHSDSGASVTPAGRSTTTTNATDKRKNPTAANNVLNSGNVRPAIAEAGAEAAVLRINQSTRPETAPAKKVVANPYKKTVAHKMPRHLNLTKKTTRLKSTAIENPYKNTKKSNMDINSNTVGTKRINHHQSTLMQTRTPSEGIPELPKFRNPYLKRKRPPPVQLSLPSPTSKQKRLVEVSAVGNMDCAQASDHGIGDGDNTTERNLNPKSKAEKEFRNAQEITKTIEDNGTMIDEFKDISMTQYEDENVFDYGTQWNESYTTDAHTPYVASKSSIGGRQENKGRLSETIVQYNEDDHQSSSIPDVMHKVQPLHEKDIPPIIQQHTPYQGKITMNPNESQNMKLMTSSSSGVSKNQMSASTIYPRSQTASSVTKMTPKVLSYRTPIVSTHKRAQNVRINHNSQHQSGPGSSIQESTTRHMPFITPHKLTTKLSRYDLAHPNPQKVSNEREICRNSNDIKLKKISPTPHKLTSAVPGLSQRHAHSSRKAIPNSIEKTVNHIASNSTLKPSYIAPITKNPYKTPRSKPKVTPYKSPTVQQEDRKWKNTVDPNPKMVFLSEAIGEAKNRATFSAMEPGWQWVQIQGIVMTDPHLTKCSGNIMPNEGGDPIDKITAFCLDDGTAIVDVLYKKTTSIGNDKTHEIATQELLSMLSLSHPRKVAKGDRIECTGYLQYVRSPQSNDDANTKEKILCFMVKSISFVSDPNMETLRITQIAYVRKSPTESKRNFSMNPRLPMKVTPGIHIFGNPKGRKSCPIIYRPDKVFVDPQRLMHFINLSNPTGLSFHDLEALFQFETVQEICALRNSLKMLQTDYEIYVSRTGSYLPM